MLTLLAQDATIALLLGIPDSILCYKAHAPAPRLKFGWF